MIYEQIAIQAIERAGKELGSLISIDTAKRYIILAYKDYNKAKKIGWASSHGGYFTSGKSHRKIFLDINAIRKGCLMA